jgi:hypothetical protein
MQMLAAIFNEQFIMGYDIHITRQENWYDDDISKQISLTEWKQYIESDSEMRLDNFAEATLQSGDKIRLENEGLAVWKNYTGDNVHSNHAWFDFRNGNITVKNPDDEIMKKMLNIAEKLEARMQGDEGEIYDLFEINKTSSMLNTFSNKTKRPWWKFW